jgi:hypothetical protein
LGHLVYSVLENSERAGGRSTPLIVLDPLATALERHRGYCSGEIGGVAAAGGVGRSITGSEEKISGLFQLLEQVSDSLGGDLA